MFAGQAWHLNELSKYRPFEQGSARYAFNCPATVLHADAPAGTYSCTWCTAKPLGRCNTPNKKRATQQNSRSAYMCEPLWASALPSHPFSTPLHNPPHDAQQVRQSTVRTALPCKCVSHTPIVRHRMLQMMCSNQKAKHAGGAAAIRHQHFQDQCQQSRARQSRHQYHSVSAEHCQHTNDEAALRRKEGAMIYAATTQQRVHVRSSRRR